MALPKGKLMALLAVFAAIGIITATGAFTTVSADRTATVNVTGDASANLGLQPHDTSPNANYSEITDGTLTLTLDSINYNAKTTIINVFTITNNGEDTVNITIDKKDFVSDDSSNGRESSQETGMVTFFVDDGATPNEYDGSSEDLSGRNLNSGNSYDVSIEVDTKDFLKGDDGDSGNNVDDLLDELTIKVSTTGA